MQAEHHPPELVEPSLEHLAQREWLAPQAVSFPCSCLRDVDDVRPWRRTKAGAQGSVSGCDDLGSTPDDALPRLYYYSTRQSKVHNGYIVSLVCTYLLADLALPLRHLRPDRGVGSGGSAVPRQLLWGGLPVHLLRGMCSMHRV